MREKMIRGDYLECVIGLGANLFYNSPMEACIVICRMNKTAARRGKVLFINTVNEVERKNAQSYLEDKHIQKIAQAYAQYETIDGFAKVATLKEIEENAFSLSIPLYVKDSTAVADTDHRSLQEIYTEWSALSSQMKDSFTLLNTMLTKEGESDANG